MAGKSTFGLIQDIVGSARKLTADMPDKVDAGVLVGPGESADLLKGLRAALYPQSAAASVHVRLNDGTSAANELGICDFCVVTAGSRDYGLAASAWHAAQKRGEPCVIAGLFASERDAMACETLLVEHGVDERDLLLGLDPRVVIAALPEWIFASIDESRHDAVAIGFSFCRDVLARMIVAQASKENGLVSMLGMLPGADADFIVMTGTQAAMAIRLARIYGRRVDARLAPELIGVVGAGFGMRSLARLLLRTFLPGPVVRAGVGIGGTVAMGEALTRHFRGIPWEEGEIVDAR